MSQIMVKDTSIFLPLETENTLFLIQRILFGISCILHVPALFCLLRETPPHQAIAVILTDFHYSILFEPIPLAEVFAAYCRGLLCRSVGPTKAMGTFGFFGGALCTSTITCIIVRHQSMMPPSSPWKLHKITKRILFVIVMFSIVVPTTAFTVYPFSVEESERLIDESNYEIGWIRERGAYIKVPESMFMHVILWTAISLVFMIIIIATILFWHMFYVLSQETQSSERTKRLIRQSLWRLYAQLNAPILFFAIPMNVYFLQMGTRCFPFMIGVIAPFFICLHPIVHNLVLLLIFPTYRRIIAEAATGRCLKRPRVDNSMWSMTLSPPAHY